MITTSAMMKLTCFNDDFYEDLESDNGDDIMNDVSDNDDDYVYGDVVPFRIILKTV